MTYKPGQTEFCINLERSLVEIDRLVDGPVVSSDSQLKSCNREMALTLRTER